MFCTSHWNRLLYLFPRCYCYSVAASLRLRSGEPTRPPAEWRPPHRRFHGCPGTSAIGPLAPETKGTASLIPSIVLLSTSITLKGTFYLNLSLALTHTVQLSLFKWKHLTISFHRLVFSFFRERMRKYLFIITLINNNYCALYVNLFSFLLFNSILVLFRISKRCTRNAAPNTTERSSY